MGTQIANELDAGFSLELVKKKQFLVVWEKYEGALGDAHRQKSRHSLRGVARQGATSNQTFRLML
jgi:hypothetical protein